MAQPPASLMAAIVVTLALLPWICTEAANEDMRQGTHKRSLLQRPRPTKPTPTPAPNRAPTPAPTRGPTAAPTRLPPPPPPVRSPPPPQSPPTPSPPSPSPPPPSPPPPNPPLAPGYCYGAGGLVMYANPAAPLLSYNGADAAKSAVGVCSNIGRAPADLAAADASVITATMEACAVPSQTFVYTAAPAYTSEDDFCPFAEVTKTGAAAAYTATLWPQRFACNAKGFGAWVVCA